MTGLAVSTKQEDRAIGAEQDFAMRLEMFDVFRNVSSGTRVWLIIWNAPMGITESIEIRPQNEGRVMGFFTGAFSEYPCRPDAFCHLEGDHLVTRWLTPSNNVVEGGVTAVEGVAYCIEQLRAAAENSPTSYSEDVLREYWAAIRENEARDRQEFLDLQFYRFGPIKPADCLIECERDGEPTSTTHEGNEQLWTPLQIGRQWLLNAVFIRNMFEGEPDIMRLKHLKRSKKRKFVSMLLPPSVAERVGQKYGLIFDRGVPCPGCV